MIERTIGIKGDRDSCTARRRLAPASVLALLCACATSEVMAASGTFTTRAPSIEAPAMISAQSPAGLGQPADPNPACLSPSGRTSGGTYFNYAPGNAVVFLNIGAGNAVTGASVDASVSAVAQGRPSDSMILFSSTAPDDPNGVLFQLESTDGLDATEVSTGGVVHLGDGTLPAVVPGNDGYLRIEWFNRDARTNESAREPDVFWSDSSAPSVCQGIHLACTNQAACDAAVGGNVTGLRSAAAATMATGSSALWMLGAGFGLFVLLTRRQLIRGDKHSA